MKTKGGVQGERKEQRGRNQENTKKEAEKERKGGEGGEIKRSENYRQPWRGHSDVGVIHSSESNWRLANHNEVDADGAKGFEAWRRRKIVARNITFQVMKEAEWGASSPVT